MRRSEKSGSRGAKVVRKRMHGLYDKLAGERAARERRAEALAKSNNTVPAQPKERYADLPSYDN